MLKRHLDEDVLERYVMNRLSESQAEAVEDHICLCGHCGNRLDQTTAYVGGIRSILRKPVEKPGLFSWLLVQTREQFTLWAVGAVALAVAILLFFVMRPVPLSALATVVVSGTRGESTIVHGTGPFDFQLFMPEAAANYHVELLDKRGKPSWKGNVAGHDGHLHAVINHKIAAGQYFLHVTEPVSKVLRDFGVTIER